VLESSHTEVTRVDFVLKLRVMKAYRGKGDITSCILIIGTGSVLQQKEGKTVNQGPLESTVQAENIDMIIRRSLPYAFVR
jgi:hypothetical protein